MDEIDFVYVCPNCEEEFIGFIHSDAIEKNFLVTCEDCGHKYSVKAELKITVSYE